MTAHIIFLGVSKGGSGKTTTAQNLAAYFVTQGLRGLGLDIDGQASWSHLQNLFPKKGRPTIYTAIKQLIETYEAKLPTYTLRQVYALFQQWFKQSIEAYNSQGKRAAAYEALAKEILTGAHQVSVQDLQVPAGYRQSLP